MSKFEDFMGVLQENAIQEETCDLATCATKAIAGDAESFMQLSKKLLNAPAFYKNVAFIRKLTLFFRGTCTDEDNYKKLAEIIANGDQVTNAERILDCLDAIETEIKVKYVINATRSYIRAYRGMRGLEKSLYFRMLYVIKNILLEDIDFLVSKIKLSEVSNSDSCVALESLGLMYITTSDEEVKYAFSRLAYIFYDEVIRGDDEIIPKIEMPSNFPRKMDMRISVKEF